MQRTRQAGFTIVELLIVIVVIAILAAIVIVAYNGVQARAYDSRRLQDIAEINKAIQAYKVTNGVYPPVTAANQDASWYETSYVTGSFLDPLRTNGLITKVPVDPINNSTYFYRYYLYGAGEYGCDMARGPYYVLSITHLQATSNYGQGPGFACGTRNWAAEDAQWVTGDFTN